MNGNLSHGEPVDSPDELIRFSDLRSSGRALAAHLRASEAGCNSIALAIVLGGLPVAAGLAESLGLQLDLVIIRRLLAPPGAGTQISAVNVCGSLVLDNELAPRLALGEPGLDHFVAEALEQLAQRVRTCRGGRPPIDLTNKTIVLVDCGIRTGSTIRTAIRALRTKRPERIVVAVPVAAEASREIIEEAADEVICLGWKKRFGHTGLWYEDFRRPGDAQVVEMLRIAE